MVLYYIAKICPIVAQYAFKVGIRKNEDSKVNKVHQLVFIFTLVISTL